MKALFWSSLRLALVMVLIPVAAATGAVGGFFGALRFLETSVGDEQVETPPVAPTLAVPPDAARLEELLAEDAGDEPEVAEPTPPPPAGDTVLRQVMAGVRLHKPLDPTQVGSLTCADIAGSRNLLWAMNGYNFQSPEAIGWLMKQQGALRGDPSVSLAQVEAALTPIDLENRATLSAALKARSCPCAEAATDAPCPD